jgi:hypothetical protein
MFAKNKYGGIKLSSKSLSFQNILIDFSSFEDIFLTDDEKFTKTSIGSLRLENFKKTKKMSLSLVIDNLINVSQFFKNDMEKLTQFLIVFIFEEIYENYLDFKFLDEDIEERCFAYLLDIEKKIQKNLRSNLILYLKTDKFKDLKNELKNKNFGEFLKLLNEERLNMLNITNRNSLENIIISSDVLIEDVDVEKLNEFKSEILKLSKLNHPNIISILGYYLDSKRIVIYNKKAVPFQDIYQNFNFKDLLKILREIAFGVKYLHEKNITHEILNEKTVFFENGKPKIGMLGRNALNNVGTILQLKQIGRETSIDIYQFGLLLVFITKDENLIKSMNSSTLESLKKKKKFPDKLIELIKRCCLDQNCNSIDIPIYYLNEIIKSI